MMGVASVGAYSQNRNRVTPSSTPAAVFAVLDSGKYIEPIGLIEEGKLNDFGEKVNFDKTFYSTKNTYSLIFGGSVDGKVDVTRSLVGTECGGKTAEVNVTAERAKLSLFVAALATNISYKSKLPFYRRLPTKEERGEIENLVKGEFRKNGVSSSTANKLQYHNLTAIDVNGDDIPEMVGSYWLSPKNDERRLLFFIAEKAAGGAYSITYRSVSNLKAKDVMSGDMKDVDNGILHELLVDSIDIDGDGTAEIFTTLQAFEGRNFYAYKKANGRWMRIFTSYNYRCGY
jgi:hypothetical protein